MDASTLDKANALVEIIGIHSRVITKLKGINRDTKVLIISNNNELYETIRDQVQDYDKRNPGNTASIELGSSIKDCMMTALLDAEDTALKDATKKLEAL